MSSLKQGYQPLGLTLNLHKYYNPPKEHFDDTVQYIKNYLENQESFTTFGSFDQLSFGPVMEFADFREKVNQTYTWLGNRQSVLLYPVSPPSKRHYGFSGSHFGKVNERGFFSEIESNYLLITLLYTSGGAKASLKSYNCFLDYCRNAIYTIADNYNKKFAKKGRKLGCEVFGTFNSAELAVIWDTDELVDVLYLVDNLRYLTLCGYENGLRHRAFISSHTFVALTKRDTDINGTRGGAMIHLAGRTSAGIEQSNQSGYEVMSDYVKNVGKSIAKGNKSLNYMCCAGEYDLILQTDQKLLSKLFQATGQLSSGPKFSMQNSDFSAHVLESATRIYYTEEDIKDLKDAFQNDWVTNQDGPGLLDVNVSVADQSKEYSRERMDLIEKINLQDPSVDEDQRNNFTLFQELSHCVASISHASPTFQHTLDLAYIDYVQCITTAVDHLWVKDFNSQFHVALSILLKCGKSLENALENLDDDYEISPSDYLELMQDVFRSLQQQCYHVVDSGKFFLEEPRSHYSYTGQYDLMMHAYYGILKCLLEQLHIPDRPQSSLYPLINFESAPILSSRLYLEDLCDTPDISPLRLLVIRLPYNDAWTSLDHYVPMLIHELYHYAAPRNRIQRNYLFGCILMTWMHSRIFSRFVNTLVQNGKKSELLEEAALLLTNRVEEILAEQFGNLLYPPEYSNETDCFRVQYINYLLGLLEDSSARYSKILEQIIEAIVKGLSEIKSRDEWKNRFCHANQKEQDALDQLLNQIISELQPKNNRDRERFLSDYGSLLEEGIAGFWEPMLDALKELFPDVAMVKLAGLDAAGYLLQFSIDQNNQLLTPNDMPLQNSIRIGCILDWILDCLPKNGSDNTLRADCCVEKLKKVRDRFLKMYSRIYKETNQIGEQWFDYYINAYKIYLESCSIYAEWFDPLIREEYLLCLEKDNHSESVQLLTSLCKEYYDILVNSDDSHLKEALFDHTIRVVQNFQIQKSLEEIHCGRKVPVSVNSPGISRHVPSRPLRLENSLTDYKWNSYLQNTEELHAHLSHAVQRLRESHQRVFLGAESYRPWFRGCRNATFDVLPSIMVHFLDGIVVKDFKGVNSVGTLLDYQRNLLEEFKFRADGAPELLNISRYHRLDYLALMQHYGQYTGLLDWSEDAYSSLYFALEKFIDDPKKIIKADDEEDAAAALYIFDPMLYNFARKKMLQTINTIPEEYKRTLRGENGYVPNLSIRENSEQYSLFIPGGHADTPPKLYHSVSSRPEKIELEDVEKDELHNLPLAIYTSRLNPRLRAQSGMFLSYNLRSVPVLPRSVSNPTDKVCSAELFHYLSLESIQRYYLSKFPFDEPFLLKLHIDKHLKRELGDTLRFLGMHRYRMYPELEQLAKKYQ